ncbi:hypothetical protein RIF29_41435 [Crotalaria pallida]|uniref:Uncharacterized protein n=1 Tax=Crotalaria pallida TaxID=3830 RepID=A0AAN9E6E1_CROPI
MGCCVSTSDNSDRSSPPKDSAESRAPPPPPPLEEETVKEVLSETPKWKPAVAKFEAEKPTVAKFETEKITVAKFGAEKITVAKFEEKMALPINKGDEEISEVCSLSESVSTTTLTEEEPRQRVNRSPSKMSKNRSFSGEFGGGGGGGGGRGKSPARRTEQSPGKRNVRVVQSRECQMGNNSMMRNQPRRDNSGRRSMSPVTRADNVAARSVVGRSPSARRTNQSPARNRTAVPENGGRKRESPTAEQSANESLENPLVSLECFIFL